MENKKPEQNKAAHVSFIENMGDIYEEVVDWGIGEPVFVKYDKLTNQVVDIVERVDIRGTKYLPINNDIVKKKIVLLPSEATEYDNAQTLITLIRNHIHKYLDLSELGEFLSACYVLLSWIFDNFEVIPYLRFLGDYGTGKSRALKTIGNIAYKPIFCGGAVTVSPIFRLIEDFKGTLIIDEADFSISEHHAEIIKILNCGFTKGLPVLRTEGDSVKQPRAFDVFSPKIIGTRNSYKDLALESRCLTEIMKGEPRSDIPLQLPKEFERESLALRNMLLMFRFRNYGVVELDDALRIKGVEPRINQIAMPILSIIDDESERNRIKDYILEYDKTMKIKRSDELPAVILKSIISLHNAGDILSHKRIAEDINIDRGLNGEYKISPAKVGRINSDLGFKVRKVNGVSEILWEEDRANILCNRFGYGSLEGMSTSSTSSTNTQAQIESL